MPRVIVAAVMLALLTPAALYAQDPVPEPIPDEPIGRFVLDARGVWARFKANTIVASELGVDATDLPGRGLGVSVGAHVYPLRGRGVALGLGADLLLRARASRTKEAGSATAVAGRTVVTRMTAFSPQLSLNFGKRDGYSYVSGGIGSASLVTELEEDPLPDGGTRPITINYGGGARWFTSKHVAVSVDLRFYAMRPQDATATRPALPRMTVLVFGAGIGLR